MNPVREGLGLPEHDGVEALVSTQKLDLEMTLADDTLAAYCEYAVEGRPRKALAPDPVTDRVRQRKRELAGLERAIRFDRPAKLCRGERLAGHRLEGCREPGEVALGQGQPRRVRVAAEAPDRAGSALCDEVERIAQMESGDRASGPAQLAAVRAGERDDRTVEPVLDPRRHDADHPWVPCRAVEAQAAGVVRGSH